MEEIKDLENYIEQLLNTSEVDNEVFAEIPNIQLLLWVYMLGLQKKDFDPTILLHTFTLKEIPEQFHTLIAQLAIIKEKNFTGQMKYMLKTTEPLLKEFKNYFLKELIG